MIPAEGKDAESYGSDYYRAIREGATASAEVIVPLLLDLVKPRSVIDVGCATGSWLSVFRAHGVKDVWGVDGEHVDRGMLEIPEERFVVMDLAEPFVLDQQFDLVVSLEVAEHLPARSASAFVKSLTRLGPAVLFSAAIPFQAGRRHVNEQWPEYWAERFRNEGYVAVDCLRRKIWQDERVQWWYAQNILLYTTSDHLKKWPRLGTEYEHMGTTQLALVHPQKYVDCIEWGVNQQELISKALRGDESTSPPGDSS